MPTTTDPNDPRLGHGIDDKPTPQQGAYLVLSDEERAKGFVRPVRYVYIHVGPPGPKYPTRDLTNEEKALYQALYVKFEPYPEGSHAIGRFWTQEELDTVGKGCKTSTTMAQPLAETWAREPRFYGATYCVQCQKHLAVNEFVWAADGTVLGS